MRLDGKVLVVAAGGQGIGAATARRLASEGASVVVGDLDPATARSVAEGIVDAGGRAIGVGFDIADAGGNQILIAAAVETYGGLDGVHINAADMRSLMSDGDVLGVDLAVFDRTIAVNLRGHLLCTRAALPELVKRGGGALVYTASTAAFAGEPVRVSYAMAKSGLLALMRHVASAFGRQGVRANAVAPGFVVTPELEGHVPPEFLAHTQAQTPHPRLGRVGDIAAMVAHLLSDDGAWVNGQTITVDGGVIMR
jgi:NAD(P)-dependent dehydrogenase (short-subunit alcohol dehydrogenase family)